MSNPNYITVPNAVFPRIVIENLDNCFDWF